MSSSASLAQRLQALADSYKQTLHLIQELQRFPNSPIFAQEINPDEKRLEIGNEIHQNLKDQEDSLELLKQEVSDADSDSIAHHSRSASTGTSSRKQQERDRNAALATRLTEDLKIARRRFRAAQLQAKRNASEAKRKEREELFAGRTTGEGTGGTTSRRDGRQQLTQDELAVNAAEDVTRSLRRAHELLTGTLSQSQFAQQTLDESSEALRGLRENYGGTTDLLKSSRGLVKTLVASQKSDTWFLITSTYILFGTIAWLIFRRLLYGPLWWLVYQPLKMLWWFTLVSLGTVGLGGGQKTSSSVSISSFSTATHGIPTRQAGSWGREVRLPPKGGGWDRDAGIPERQQQSPEMVEKISQIIDQTDQAYAADEARNTKKRMLDTDVDREPAPIKDEL